MECVMKVLEAEQQEKGAEQIFKEMAESSQI